MKRKKYTTLKSYIHYLLWKRYQRTAIKILPLQFSDSVGFYIIDRCGNLYGKAK